MWHKMVKVCLQVSNIRLETEEGKKSRLVVDEWHLKNGDWYVCGSQNLANFRFFRSITIFWVSHRVRDEDFRPSPSIKWRLTLDDMMLIGEVR